MMRLESRTTLVKMVAWEGNGFVLWIKRLDIQPARVQVLKEPGNLPLMQRMPMSRARFAKHFNDVVGMTPGTSLGDWRVGLAKSMLLNGASLQTIAGDVGYGSASALSRVFSSRCGMSPTEWHRSVQA